MNRLHPWLLLLATFEGVCGGAAAWGYEGNIHQQLTFMAARQFNHCVESRPDITRLSALDTRYIVKANVAQADTNVFVRMFRWNYYNRSDQTNRTSWGLIDTRLHDHFSTLTDNVDNDDRRRQQLRNLGRLVNYIQNATAPANVVPVYSGRWWRLSLSDRFSRYPLDPQRTQQALGGSCQFVATASESYQAVLIDTASDTVEAVQGQIFGFPTSWESYWQFADKADQFGEYGAAGNSFGERTEFRCGQGERCLLLRDDPVYSDFAVQRHVAAVTATMRAMMLLQMAKPADR